MLLSSALVPFPGDSDLAMMTHANDPGILVFELGAAAIVEDICGVDWVVPFPGYTRVPKRGVNRSTEMVTAKHRRGLGQTSDP